MKKLALIDILGTKISILDYPTLLTLVRNKINGKSGFICVAAVHLLMESHNNKKLQASINKSLVTTPDGMPIVWIAKSILKRRVQRIYGPDLMLEICKMSQKNGYKIFLLGGAKDQGADLKMNLLKRFPKLKIVGVEETPVRPIPKKQNQIIVNKIKKTKPNIIFVGLGCPLQEEWMIQNYKKFNRGIFVGVGAAFDFISNRVKQAPTWMQGIGLEWFFRLLQDPKRLWRRYLILNTRFIFQVVTKYKHFYAKEITLS